MNTNLHTSYTEYQVECFVG